MHDKCNADSCFLLRTAGKQFLFANDLKTIEWEELFTHFSKLDYTCYSAHLDKLLEETIYSPLNIKYPLRRSYQLAFLKRSISQAEKHGLEYSSGYEAYCSLIKETDASEDASYKHYSLADRVITLKESNQLIGGGTTGLSTWQAGVSLGNWCLKNKEYLAGRRVTELGCGLGLTGLAVLLSGTSLTQYTFTDCHPLVLKQLRDNLELNLPGDTWPRLYSTSSVDVEEYRWGDTLSPACCQADVILGADIVYDPDLIELLCDTLGEFLAVPNKVAIIATTRRNPDTVNRFLTALEKRSLKVCKDSSDYPVVLVASDPSPVDIFIVRGKPGN